MDIAALLQGQGPAQPDQPPDPLQTLQECIQAVHSLLTALPDAAHTQMATQALAILTKIQRDLMAEGQGPAGMAQRLQGG